MSKVHRAVVIVRDDVSSTMTWSGIPNHIVKILKDYGVHVTVVDQLGYPMSLRWRLKRFLHKAFRTQLPKYYSLETSKYYANLLNRRLENIQDDFDFILAIDFTEGLPFFKCKKPVFVFRDASYLQLNELKYPGYEHFSDDDCRHIQAVEHEGFKSCRRVLLTSQWSVNYCRKFYPDIAPEKFSVLPFSAQVYPPPCREDWTIRSIDGGSTINFLFVGRDWDRKGGPKAINIMRELGRLGLKVSLTIVGGSPDLASESFEIKVIENLDLSKPGDRDQMIDLYKNAHFFILPVNIEAFGIVFSEAMSFGLPVITHNICALPEIMKDEHQGICLDKDTGPEVFAERVKELVQDSGAYEMMQESCFIRFSENFHPKSWVERLLSIVQ